MKTSPLQPILFNQLQYTSEQLFDVYAQLRTLWEKSPIVAQDAMLRQVTGHFNEAHDTLGKCLGRIPNKPGTEAIRAADEERDNLWMGLNGEISAKVRLSDPNRRAAAERLNKLISERFDRTLHRLDLEENSTALEQFFATIDGSKESQGDLALLGLAIDWYVPLKAAQERFRNLVASSKEDAVNRETLPQSRVASQQAARKLRLIIDLCEDHAEEGREAYIQLHRSIEEIISGVRTKAKATETRDRKKRTAVKTALAS